MREQLIMEPIAVQKENILKKNVHGKIFSEVNQDHVSRRNYILAVEEELGRPVVSFFTSFNYPVSIDDNDCEMLQSILQNLDTSRGLALMISTPGGDGLSAERIVNICRAYSGTGEYWAIVPGKAKSAGTIIAMGASKIFMAPFSELGPVDPQIAVAEDGQSKWFSAHSLIEGGTLSHGRPIYAVEAAACGLAIEPLNVNTALWENIYELYLRTERFVSRQACKALESKEEAFCAPISR